MTVVLLNPDPATSTETTTIEAIEGTLVKRALKPTVIVSTEKHQTQTTGVKYKIAVFPNESTAEVIVEKAIIILSHSLQLLNQEEEISAFGTSLILTKPPIKPSGSIVLYTGETLNGQRLRGGDFHSLKIYIRGTRLDLFKIFFRFRPINSENFIIKEEGSGLVNFESGTDPTTNEESLTITSLIYQEDLKVNSDQEFTYELECDDLLGFKAGIIDSGSFTVYSD